MGKDTSRRGGKMIYINNKNILKADIQVELNKLQEKHKGYIYVDEIFDDGSVFLVTYRVSKDGLDDLNGIMKKFDYALVSISCATGNEDLLLEYAEKR